ncbi:hypothetical protein [Aquamicrobium defluvii]|uniref:hypothetical protein n=1 Tax=Aquamicrobium defluvii TaxID=69279 RepID=UPI001061C0E2|nr:hypothetical protein [Aquamicrobium defluvii]HMN14344.1 hypothetical protein [Bellilinea sp.]
MGTKKIVVLILAALGFATLMLYMLTTQNRPLTPSAERNTRQALVFSGKLDIRTMDDLRIGGRKILLCGVGFTRPRALEPMAREQARKAHQRQQFDCVQVGGGTPCDGRMGTSFDGVAVVQCRTAQGADLAQELSEQGYLCDLPAQSGGIYRNC